MKQVNFGEQQLAQVGSESDGFRANNRFRKMRALRTLAPFEIFFREGGSGARVEILVNGHPRNIS